MLKCEGVFIYKNTNLICSPGALGKMSMCCSAREVKARTMNEPAETGEPCLRRLSLDESLAPREQRRACPSMRPLQGVSRDETRAREILSSLGILG